MDPLEQAREDGEFAALELLESIGSDDDLHGAIMQLRAAAFSDTKSNYHLFETVIRLALCGMDALNEYEPASE